MNWHIITCEYPPRTGGVSDYTCSVASGLAAQGDEVHVWCPAGAKPPAQAAGVTVHQDLGAFSRADLRACGDSLDQFAAPRRILVQWVPHGYGWRSMNVAFCWWLWKRARLGDQVEIMVHEAYHSFRWGAWRQSAAALVHRLMTILLVRSAKKVWMSIPDWERCWKPYAMGRPVPFEWLPIPSSILANYSDAGQSAVRRKYAGGGELLIGHFGTHGSPVTSLLDIILPALNRSRSKPVVLLLGAGSMEYRDRVVRSHPELSQTVQAAGALSETDLSSHLAACDLLIQPYLDGVSTRRTSAMAGLIHGKPIVTTVGHLTEPFWSETGAIALVPVGQPQEFVAATERLLNDKEERERMGRAAKALYDERFEISRVIATLRHLRQTSAQEPAAPLIGSESISH